MSAPLLRYHGSKWRIAPWIISHFPHHRTYVEPFGGSAAVLFRKPPSDREVYNDRDDVIVNFFRVVRERPQELIKAVTHTPYARTEYHRALELTDDPVESARRTLIRAFLSFGSGGATREQTGFRADTNRNGKTIGELLQRSREMIDVYAERMRRVLIENRNALKVIDDHDRPDTLIYADPPYLPATRSNDHAIYRHEMSIEDHERLLDKLNSVRSMVVLSGYDSEVYNDTLNDWSRQSINTQASGQKGCARRTETLWFSPNIGRRVLL